MIPKGRRIYEEQTELNYHHTIESGARAAPKLQKTSKICITD